MKVVLCHQATGRYFQSPGQWVRRADNAMAFEDVDAAFRYSRIHHLQHAKPVFRLAPFLMPLLQGDRASSMREWKRERAGSSPAGRKKFVEN